MNPQKDVFKIVALIAIIALAGFFVWKSSSNRGLDQSGKAYNSTSTSNSNPGMKICFPHNDIVHHPGVGTNPGDCEVNHIDWNCNVTQYAGHNGPGNSCVVNGVVYGPDNTNNYNNSTIDPANSNVNSGVKK